MWGNKGRGRPRITLTEYDETHFRAEQVETIKACFPLADGPSTTWINIDGIHQVEILEAPGTISLCIRSCWRTS